MYRRALDVEDALPSICMFFGEEHGLAKDLQEADARIVELEKQHMHDVGTAELLQADVDELKDQIQKLLREIDGMVYGRQ